MRAVEYEGTGGWGQPEAEPDPQVLRARRARTGLRVFMAVISSLFLLFVLAFMIRSQLADWQHLTAPWKPLSDPWQLYVNTVMLALGSVCLQWARVASRRGQLKATVEGLALAGVFTGGFLLGQLWMWQHLAALGYYMHGNPATSFFYLLTGLHALHLLGGMVAWSRATLKAWRAKSPDAVALTVDLCAMYWHYLLALWVVLLLLLTSSPNAYAAFARLCGF